MVKWFVGDATYWAAVVSTAGVLCRPVLTVACKGTSLWNARPLATRLLVMVTSRAKVVDTVNRVRASLATNRAT
ncbi:hypothetical protein PF005_g21414 [Phytophthora fragariae]|uniref:Uncharacterized protein n=1 Tax=Phytophthora fragariae TaxID=53985 RepID=A0A6A3SZ95_9STRA|nr:hypothetical protein PF003_g6328 [Phytophthora fragariae]KAE8942987.1 hypothetical protein PF009_g7272 [Phytophthora fragariae]KAE9018349.1 hypothetical protein PF011_g6295 [Phytophthora fragariae]KAE9120248.1 hypothetical protein PF010_g7556 [Phytophthora fragariae]KAE9126485.1 hypothetical protein PF007_g5971 [Phytophthora fragariae]